VAVNSLPRKIIGDCTKTTRQISWK